MRLFLIILFLTFGSYLGAQDFLSLPTSNPKLFNHQYLQTKGEKQQVFEPNFIYEYDTLNLPFLDDFSVNYLPKRRKDTSGLKDTTIYSIYVNGNVYRDTFGFTLDTTYRYFLSTAGDTISSSLNGPVSISVASLTIGKEPIFRTVNAFRAYTHFDTFGTASDSISVAATFLQDSLRYYIVPPDSNAYYTDRHVYVNNTFGINPPTIGVATFDGLDEFGLAYDFTQNFKILADKLTSVPLDLSNQPDTNIYFSFYYQPKGLSIDKPERGDSLVLDFYNPSTAKWSNFWDTTGFKADTFRQVIIKVPNDFHAKGFQFRFKNYGTPTGGFDQWNIDYLYLNNGRSPADTVRYDLAYVYDAPSLLKDYYAMPYFHFRTNPPKYMADSAYTVVRNLSNQKFQVYNFLNVPDTTTGTDFYQYPASNTFVQLTEKILFTFRYPLQFSFPANKVNSTGIFKSPFSVDFRPGTSQRQDFIRSNDTIIAQTILKDYYAYDDGSAEAGYGVNPDLSADGRTAFMAVQFSIPFPDTLKGIQTYFFPQANDITKQTFVLTVWSRLNPATILFEDTLSSKPVYSDVNGFVGYAFDSAVVVDTNFYVGLKAIGKYSLNIGFDLNSNSRSKIFWSQDGLFWSNPSSGIFDGSLMLRPVFRNRVFDVGIHENENIHAISELKLYPNPAQNNLFVEFTHLDKVNTIEVLDLNGRVISQLNAQQTTRIQHNKFHSQLKVDVSAFYNGFYLLKITDVNGQVQTKKFIINR